MMNTRYIFWVIGISLFPLFAQAQDDPDLPSDEIEAIENYRAQIEDSDKVNLVPAIPAMDTTRSVLEYNIVPKLLDLTYDAPELKPLDLSPRPLPATYEGYVKAGVSFPLGGRLDAGYTRLNDKWKYGADAYYHGMYDESRYEHRNFTRAGAALSLGHYFDDGPLLGASVGYDFDNRFYYGYDHDTGSIIDLDLKQVVNRVSGKIDVVNADVPTSDINYGVHLDYGNTSIKLGGKENTILAKGNFQKYFGGKHALDIHITNEYSSFSNDTSQTNNILSLTPSFTYHHPVIRAKAGANVFLINDQIRVAPEIEFLFKVYKDIADFYFGWTGDAKVNSWESQFNTNPFIYGETRIENTFSSTPFGGVRGEAGKFKYDIYGKYSFIENELFFLSNYDANSVNQFNTIYGDLNILNIGTNINSEVIENLFASFRFDYFNYNLDNVQVAFNKPEFSGNLGVNYQGLLSGKLGLGAGLIFQGKTPNLLISGDFGENPAIIDLGLDASYRMNDGVKFFLDLNNLMNRVNAPWHTYPTVGFNGTVGVLVKFGKRE